MATTNLLQQQDDPYSPLKDLKLEITSNDDVNRGFSLCFWLYLTSDSSPFLCTILHQRNSDMTSTAPFLALTASKEIALYPIQFIPPHKVPNSNNMMIPSAKSKTEVLLDKWVHVGCEVSVDVMRLYINGEIVGETGAICSYDSLKKVTVFGSNEGDSVKGYVHGVQILPVMASVKDCFVKDPPWKLDVHGPNATDIEEDSNGVWIVVGGKASCRRKFSLDVVLVDAFGHSVNKAIEVVASLTYDDNGAHVEKRDDLEAPLLTSYDGTEFASSDRPSKIVNGRASFKLKISQLSSKCDNRLFRIKFSIPKMKQSYPFLEAFSRSILCISRNNNNTRPSTLIWKRSASAIHAVSGTSWLDGDSVEAMSNVVHEAKPTPSSKRIKLGHGNPSLTLKPDHLSKQTNQPSHEGDKPNGRTLSLGQGNPSLSLKPDHLSKQTNQPTHEGDKSNGRTLSLGQGNPSLSLKPDHLPKQTNQPSHEGDKPNGRALSLEAHEQGNNSSCDSDSSEATNSCKSFASNGSPVSDLTVFKYCLGNLTEKSLLLKDLASSASEEDIMDFATQVSQFSGCIHHRNQIRISKRMIEEGTKVWNLLCQHNYHVLWDDMIPVLRDQFMKISCCRNRILTQQDCEVLRRIGGCQEHVAQENFEKLWCWLYPVAFALSQNGLNDMWDSRWIEGIVTTEEAESSLHGPGNSLVDTGTFVLRFPTSRSWPHPDAGNLIVTYVGTDFCIHHRLLSLDFFRSCGGKSLKEMLLKERELSRLGRITRSLRFA